MSVAAPSPPTRVPTPPPPDAREPDLPHVLELLVASRPEREGRVLASSVVTALVIHILLLLVLLVSGPLGGHWTPVLPMEGSPEAPSVMLILPGTNVGGAGRATPPPAVERATEAPLIAPRRIPTSIPAVPAPGAGNPGTPGPGGQGQGASGAGTGAGGAGGGAAYGNSAARFRPKSWDRRLWEEPDRLLPAQSDADRVATRVQDKLDAVNDSAAAVADAARRATDWTIKDKNGKSWGVSPGKLHLGDLTLPLPLGFEAPNGRRDEFEKDQANWDDLQRSASQAEIRHTFDERVKAIRKRKEQERKDQQKNPPATTTTSSSSSDH